MYKNYLLMIFIKFYVLLESYFKNVFKFEGYGFLEFSNG